MNVNNSISFFSLLTISLIVLKLTNYFTWSWFWVLFPILIPTIINIIIFILIYLISKFENGKLKKSAQRGTKKIIQK